MSPIRNGWIPTVSTRDLILQAQQGDRAAMRELAEIYFPYFHRIVIQKCRKYRFPDYAMNSDVTLDIAQDAMLEFFCEHPVSKTTGIQRFHWGSKFHMYISRFVEHKIKQHQRAEYCWKKFALDSNISHVIARPLAQLDTKQTDDILPMVQSVERRLLAKLKLDGDSPRCLSKRRERLALRLMKRDKPSLLLAGRIKVCDSLVDRLNSRFHTLIPLTKASLVTLKVRFRKTTQNQLMALLAPAK